MQVDNVYIIYFSPVGHTCRVAETLGYALAERLGVPAFSMDMTKPAKRRETMSFAPSDVVLLAVPTYAGRVPNKLLPDLKACFRGDQTPAVAVVTFGNRNFDSSLTELRDVLEDDGFCVTAAVPAVMFFPSALCPTGLMGLTKNSSSKWPGKWP